ncbi:MAG: hypothetical protein SV377_05585, partial [Halobacteria archaeon]|nr:hypothetical protein [Halobacteria archaeon]
NKTGRIVTRWVQEGAVGQTKAYHRIVHMDREGGRMVTVSVNEFWSNETLNLVVEREENRTEYRQVNSSETIRYSSIFNNFTRKTAEKLAYIINGGSVFGPVERDGERMYWIVSTNPRYTNLDNYTVLALVDSSGIIRQLRVEYDSREVKIEEQEGNTSYEESKEAKIVEYHGIYTFRISDINSARVEDPEWIERAVKNGTVTGE